MNKVKLITTSVLACSLLSTLIKVNAESIDYNYNNSSAEIDVSYDDSIYGSAHKYLDGTSDTIKKIKESNYKNSYYTLDKYVYIIFEYDSVINSRTKRLFNDYIYVAKGNSKDITLTLSKSINTTYEESISSSLAISNTIKENASASVDISKISLEASETATSTITTSIGISHSLSYSESFSCTDHLYAQDEDTEYSWEIRANYKPYIAYLYEIEYNQNKTKKHTWYGKKYYSYSYTVNSLNYVESMYYYEMIDNTNSIGFFKYKNNGGLYCYNGEKAEDIIYID